MTEVLSFTTFSSLTTSLCTQSSVGSLSIPISWERPLHPRETLPWVNWRRGVRCGDEEERPHSRTQPINNTKDLCQGSWMISLVNRATHRPGKKSARCRLTENRPGDTYRLVSGEVTDTCSKVGLQNQWKLTPLLGSSVYPVEGKVGTQSPFRNKKNNNKLFSLWSL